MDKRMNQQLEKYLVQFKDHIKDKLAELDFSEKSKVNDLLEYVYDYERLVFSKDDFTKRRRVQCSIPEDSRCIANKSCNERCTRRRKEGSEYCGTHYKYSTTEGQDALKKMDVIAKEMEGIVYYVDDFQNIYRTEDILNEKENPHVVAKYEQLAGGRYLIKEV
jgi:hypothetical protein